MKFSSFVLCVRIEWMRGFSGSVLKCIAIITMLIDHIGATVLARFLGTGDGSIFLYQTYTVMRIIGRIAFPIFCFLLVEGFEHTKDRKRYAARLLIFAVISEVPFDLAFSGKIIQLSYQNVFFTLFIGLLTMAAFQAIEQKIEWNSLVRGLLFGGVLFVSMGIASWMHTDYAALGVMCIIVLYVFRKTRGAQILAGCLAFCWWELPALVAFIPIAFYNGKRGWNMKYIFYAFYPLHLIVLYLVCMGLGIAGISAM